MSASAGDGSRAAHDSNERSEVSRPRSRRVSWIVAVVVVIVVIGAVAVAFFATRPGPTYDEASQERFVEACVADGGDPVRPACACLYTAITETIPYDRFAEVDRQLREDRAAGRAIVLPEDVAALVPACRIPA